MESIKRWVIEDTKLGCFVGKGLDPKGPLHVFTNKGHAKSSLTNCRPTVRSDTNPWSEDNAPKAVMDEYFKRYQIWECELTPMRVVEWGNK